MFTSKTLRFVSLELETKDTIAVNLAACIVCHGEVCSYRTKLSVEGINRFNAGKIECISFSISGRGDKCIYCYSINCPNVYEVIKHKDQKGEILFKALSKRIEMLLCNNNKYFLNEIKHAFGS